MHGSAGATPDRVVDDLEVQLDVHPEPFGSLLSWADLRQLSGSIDVVPHGRHHLRLAGMADEELDEEVAQPLADIQAQLGCAAPVFSYPYGRFDANVVDAVRRAGYAAAFSTRAGFAELAPSERLKLRRVHIYHGTVAHFRLDLTSTFAWYTARREDLSAARDGHAA